MRKLAWTLLAVALAWGVWTFLRAPDEEPVYEPPAPEQPATDPETSARPVPTTVTLVVTVRDAKGAVPPGARAGYRVGSEQRMRAVDGKGQVRFTDAPVGPLTILATAPGFRADEQRRPVQPGVRADVLFVLRAE